MASNGIAWGGTQQDWGLGLRAVGHLGVQLCLGWPLELGYYNGYGDPNLAWQGQGWAWVPFMYDFFPHICKDQFWQKFVHVPLSCQEWVGSVLKVVCSMRTPTPPSLSLCICWIGDDGNTSLMRQVWSFHTHTLFISMKGCFPLIGLVEGTTSRKNIYLWPSCG